MKKPKLEDKNCEARQLDASDLDLRARILAVAVDRTDYYDWYISHDLKGKPWLYATFFNTDQVAKGPL